MLGRSSLVLLALAPMSSAQVVPSSGRLVRVTAPVRDAGILHVATNTWTRKASAASLGADTIYDNTYPSGYFAPLSGDTYVDEGRLPSPTSPTNTVSRPGCAVSYTIDGLQFGYCTDRTAPAPFVLGFFESYVGCSSVVGVTPAGSATLAGLPGTSTAGVSACWTVTIDLGSAAFVMAADGDGSYTHPSNANLFGWSMRSTAPWPEQAGTGPLIAGDENVSLHFDGTCWDPVVDYSEYGTGMGTLTQFRVEGGPTQPGCYFFDSPASFHLELYADACPGQTLMPVYCVGDSASGSTIQPCPCSNFGPFNAGTGCRNSLGLGGRLRGTGLASIAADTVVLTVDQVPDLAPMLLFQGTQRQSAVFAYGDGLRCVAGMLKRLAIVSAVGGTASYPGAGGQSLSVRGEVLAPGLRTYQACYRNAANFCTSATFNLTNGLEITWAP